MIIFLEQQIWPALFGALFGVLFAFLSWLFVKVFFSPKLKISEFISKRNIGGRAAYRIKIRNHGFRECSELAIHAKLEIKKLEWQPSNGFDSFFVDVSFGGIYPVLRKGSSILLHVFNTIQYDKSFYPSDFVNKIERASSIEDLLNLSSNTKLILYVTATDNFSGARKLYTSESYTVSSISKRTFKKNSVELSKKK